MTSRNRVSLALWTLSLAGGSVPAIAVAQDSFGAPERDRLWFAAGLGYGRTRNERDLPVTAGLSAGLWLSYQPGVILFTGRVSSVWDSIDADVVADAALLVGVGTRSQGGHLSISAGPALTSGDLDAFGDSPSSFSSRLGAAVQIQALALPLSGIGLGLTASANFNERQSFGGVMFSLAFGQLR